MYGERKYYRVDGGPCLDIVSAWHEKRIEALQQARTWAAKAGASSVLFASEDELLHGRIIKAIGFKEPLPPGWRALDDGYRERIKTRDGHYMRRPIGDYSELIKAGLLPAIPDQRMREGRELAKQIKKLALPPTKQDLCRFIKFPVLLSYSGYYLNDIVQNCTLVGYKHPIAVIRVNDDLYFLDLPDENRVRQRYVSKGFIVEGQPWEPLAGMVEISKDVMVSELKRAKDAGGRS